MVSDLEQLQRWEDSGGTWQVMTLSAERATVALMRCDGGEIADRMETEDPELLRFLADGTH